MVKEPEVPWINIPLTAQPGQPHAFVNREDALAQLYLGLVEAGNAVRRGVPNVAHKVLVHGYMGVGKSALINQALGMLRGDLFPQPEQLISGQRIFVDPDLPRPEQPQRWIILRFSGKRISNIDALPEAIQRAVAEEQLGAVRPEPVPAEVLLSFVEDVGQGARRELSKALEVPMLDRLLRSGDTRTYSVVREQLSKLNEVIAWVKRWQGATQVNTQKVTVKIDNTRDIEGHLLGQVGKKPSELSSLEKASLSAAAHIIFKNSALTEETSQVEKKWLVSVQATVDMLNTFFRATDEAKLPTLLVLDDMDEFASTIGTSHAARAKVLSWIIGPILGLQPTCLVLALRQEYRHEDLVRSLVPIQVPPMRRSDSGSLIEAWGELQTPALPSGAVGRLKALAADLLRPFPDQDRCLVPARFLGVLVWLTNRLRTQRKKADAASLLAQYLEESFGQSTLRAVSALIDQMSEDDVHRCVGAEPVESASYSLTDRVRRDLEKAGLLRPAMAGDPEDSNWVIDPLCGYLRAAQLAPKVPG